MTRKDYIKIANVFKAIKRGERTPCYQLQRLRDADQRLKAFDSQRHLGSEESDYKTSSGMFWLLAFEMIDMLAKDNNRFDATKFISAIEENN